MIPLRNRQTKKLILRNQETAAIHLESQSPLSVAGFDISGNPSKVVQILEVMNSRGQAGAMSLVDGRINVGSSTQVIDNSVDKNIYMKDVYVKGGGELIAIPVGNSQLIAASSSWKMISEYSYTGENSIGYIYGLSTTDPDNTEFTNKEFIRTSTASPDSTETIIRRHVWDDRTFPSFQDSDVVDASEHGVMSGTNVTADLQALLNNHGKVFLPGGEYMTSETISLGADDVLLGVAKNFSLLSADDINWPGDDSSKPLIRTVDDDAATTTVANIFLEQNPNKKGASFVHWRAGRNSVYRDNFFGIDRDKAATPGEGAAAAVRISGLGGGRWYGLAGEWTPNQKYTTDSEYRGLRVEGTKQDLAFYGLNVERVQSQSQYNYQIEIGPDPISKEKPENIRIYYLKGESFVPELDTDNEPTGKFTPGPGPGNIHVDSAKNFGCFAFSGNSQPAESQFSIDGVTKYTIANIGGVKHDQAYDLIRENGNKLISTPFSGSIVKRGSLN